MNLNKTPGVPHKGWNLENVVDLRLDEDLPYDEYEDCQFCGQEKIRFVHILSHSAYTEDIRVGCVCAEQLTDDYVTPRRREGELRSRASRRKTWLTRKWKISRKGHEYLNTRDGYNVGVYEVSGGRFKAWLGKKRGRIEHASAEKAKLAIFDALEKLRAKDRSTP
jgi:hypothetical protein